MDTPKVASVRFALLNWPFHADPVIVAPVRLALVKAALGRKTDLRFAPVRSALRKVLPHLHMAGIGVPQDAPCSQPQELQPLMQSLDSRLTVDTTTGDGQLKPLPSHWICM